MMNRPLAMMIVASVFAFSLGKDACGQPVPAPGPAGPQKAPAIQLLQPVVEVEQELYSYKFANNGARPMWCFGNTCMVRLGDKVFASGLKTLPDYVPINNVRWMLYQNADDKWTQVADGGDTHEREPCPVGCFSDGRFFLSVNPNSCKPDQQDGPATPQLLPFDAKNPSAAPNPLLPRWNRDLAFRAHTYRSFAADGDKHEMVLFYNIAYDKTYWTFCDSKGQWSSQGEIDFPWGKEYDKPQPVRICYPSVQLKDRAVYFCGMSDIIEPYQAWRDTKRQLTGKEFDYDFRRLFYTWSDDITTGKFHPWVEIASRDKTAGSLYPCDLWAGPDGRVHILWREQAIDTRLREKFFPDAKQSIALNYAVVRDGKVLLVKAIHQWDEGEKKEQPGRGRFHVTPDGRLLVLYYVSGTSAAGTRVTENRLVEIHADGTLGEPVKVPLKVPMESFFTAGVRGGSAPSMIIDMLGESDGSMRYCRIKLQ